MKYRVMAAIMLMLIAFSLPAHLVAGEENGVRVFIDREEISFAVPPVFLDNHLLVPLRATLEALGAEIIGWDRQLGTISARKGEHIVVLKIKEPFVWIDDKPVELDAPPTIINGSTMVPLSFFAEFLDLKLRWDAEQKTVEIESSSFIPFERPAQDLEKMPPWAQEWLENSRDELNIQAKKIEGKVYILTTYGLKTTSGYTVEIKKIERLSDTVRVVVEFMEPSNEFYTIPVIDRPFDLVSIDAAEIGNIDYLICFARGLKERELPVRLKLNP